MRKLIAVLLFALALAPVSSAAAAEPVQAVYDSAAFGLRAEYPATWKVVEGVMGTAVVFASPLDAGGDRFSENVNIVIEDLADHPGMTLGKYVATAEAKLAVYLKEFSLKDRRDATLAGRPAQVIEYTGRQGEFFVHVLQTIALVNGKAYQVTFVGEEDNYARYLPAAKRIMDSVVIR
jgi:hypothetical protein